MFETTTPEQVGISSESIKRYVELLESKHLATHSIVMVRHGKIFYENYHKPFDADFLHRLYSDSKSYVSLAIGFLLQEGLVDLNKPIVKYFDPEITENANEYMRRQTVRDMLMMCTGCPNDHRQWFYCEGPRLKGYFDTCLTGKRTKVPGALFEYDSYGSFVLCALVEELTRMSFDEFMHSRLYSKIGVSPKTYTLKCPGGHSWGDSGIMCRAVDQARVMQFVMNKGNWCGEQILSEQYLTEACSCLVSTGSPAGKIPTSYGYGYQIWQTRDNSFFFNGMGSQYAVAVPDKDMVFVINSDNQGIEGAMSVIIDGFFEEIVHHASEKPLPENDVANKDLDQYSNSLELYALKGSVKGSVLPGKINGKVFAMADNPMKITKIKFTIDGDSGVMEYTNEQGDKKLYFGIDKNVFAQFPQEGYSDLVGREFAPGNYYRCAASAVIHDDMRMSILVQAIDKYFGRLNMDFSFNDNGEITVYMLKAAEAFFDEYEGAANGHAI